MSSFNPDQERAAQIREASRMGETDGRPTLHVSRPHIAKIPSAPSAPSARNNDRRHSPAPRAKHTPKGHDAKLKSWQADGRRVTVHLMGGDDVHGVLVDSDRYTITLRSRSETESLYYKHAIEGITPISASEPETVQ